jgi:hypothetical protein
MFKSSLVSVKKRIGLFRWEGMKRVVDRCEVTTVQAGDRREICRTVDAGEILAATLRALTFAGERERQRGIPKFTVAL